MHIETIAKALSTKAKKKHGGGWMTCCPTHADRTPSLSIDESSEGKLLIHCFAGCPSRDVMRALRDRNLIPPSESNNKQNMHAMTADSATPPGIFLSMKDEDSGETRHISAIWAYLSHKKETLGYVVRYNGNDRKSFLPYFEFRDNKWRVGYSGIRPLYRLDHMADQPESTVWVFEGEKCADIGASFGLLSTASPNGSNSAPKADWSPLSGKDVTIWADNDPAGIRYANAVRTQALRNGAKSVSRVRIEDLNLAEGDDIEQWASRDGAAIEDIPIEPYEVDEPSAPETEASEKPGLFTLCALSLQDIPNEIQVDPDRVIGSLETGTVGAIVAPGGVGKSYWVLQAGVAISGGANLLEQNIQTHGRVVYLAAEDPEQVIRRRLHALAKRMTPAEWRNVTANLSILPMNGHADSKGRRFDLLDPSHEAWLSRQVAGCRLVILDTLNRVWSGDENNARDTSSVLSVMERIARKGPAVLFLHHTNKSSVLAGNQSAQQSSRGSSVLTDNARWQANMIPMSASESESLSHEGESVHGRHAWFVRLTVAKDNYGPPTSMDRWYQRTEDGVLQPVNLEKSGRASSANEDTHEKRTAKERRKAL